MTYDIKELLIKLYEFYKGVDNISSSDQVSRSIPLENEGDMGKVNENVDFRLERLKKFKQLKEKKDFVDLKNEVERDWNDYFLGWYGCRLTSYLKWTDHAMISVPSWRFETAALLRDSNIQNLYLKM
ncbi:hypothetical protein Q3G72_011456 [Acer saccharum]|nr:hypothetical protein Q3G72_011456 [Acer saccharum]